MKSDEEYITEKTNAVLNVINGRDFQSVVISILMIYVGGVLFGVVLTMPDVVNIIVRYIILVLTTVLCLTGTIYIIMFAKRRIENDYNR